MSLIFIDSGCDFGQNQIKKLPVESFNFSFILNDIEQSFDEEFDYVKFYSKLRKGVTLSIKPKSIDEYIKIFEPALKNGDDIVYIYASSEIFKVENLLKAKEKLQEKYPERVMEFLDSKNFSVGLGTLSFLLAMQYHSGATIKEILEHSYKVKDEVATYMVLDSLDTLIKNCLIEDSANQIAGTALNIKPIVTIDIDGKFRVVELTQIYRQSENSLIITNAHAINNGEMPRLDNSSSDFFFTEKAIPPRTSPPGASLQFLQW